MSRNGSGDDASVFGGDDVPIYAPEVGNDDGEPNAISVGIAEYALTTDRVALKTSGLGSCIGVAVHDEVAEISGLLHFMLPRAAEANSRQHPDAKFADTGIASMLSELSDLGGDPARSWAKVAGGAAMIDFRRTDRSIGERNVVAVRRELEVHGVSIAGADFGGNHGRTIEFDPTTGTLTVDRADGVRKEL